MSTPKRKPLPPSGRTLEATLAAWKQSGGQHLIPISGRSMLPLIRDGDRVLVQHGHTDARRGDVVVFRQGNQLIAHRVLRIYRDGADLTFVTKGDNVLHLDRPLPGSTILGRVLAVHRGNQRLSLNTAAWRLAGWLIAVGMLPGATVYSKIRDRKHRSLSPQPARLARVLNRVALSCSSFVLRLMAFVIGRRQKG